MSICESLYSSLFTCTRSYPFWTMDTPKSWRMHKGTGKRVVVRDGWLDNDDLAFEFHRQWGHSTNEHLLDELAKYYGVYADRLQTQLPRP